MALLISESSKTNMADRERDMLVRYFLHLTKRKAGIFSDKKYYQRFPTFQSFLKKRKTAFIQLIVVCLNQPRVRELWMHQRSCSWFEMVKNGFSDDQWYVNFRVTRQTFAYILNEIHRDIVRQDTTMRKSIPTNRRLALTLYYLASSAEYRTIAHLFGVSDSFVCKCIKEVCQAICYRLSQVICFPKDDELNEVIQMYEERWGFPMCAGAIDGTHIPIIAPTENHIEYVNRKGYHSILLQAVCDCHYLIRDAVIGWPGSVHDARVLSNSTIFRQGNDKTLFSGATNKMISDKEVAPVLIGDPAYPLLPWLLKPYPDKNSTQIERNFNYRLSRARMTIENTFGRLKGRFVRFAKRVDMEVPSLVRVVTASCILHNICEVQNNLFLPHWDADQPSAPRVTQVIDNLEVAGDGEDVRETIKRYFFLQNNV